MKEKKSPNIEEYRSEFFWLNTQIVLHIYTYLCLCSLLSTSVSLQLGYEWDFPNVYYICVIVWLVLLLLLSCRFYFSPEINWKSMHVYALVSIGFFPLSLSFFVSNYNNVEYMDYCCCAVVLYDCMNGIRYKLT